ncbi:putative protein OS=Tsukamurella paurometabola (strain ATCC 8368 / DSM / CCUG 35730 /CIP 100753 / JCM 10117 / KCTC 9821 / NBRC 16120 / NCIMB 702349/ NCTC 13040) OX=521096 GN=Tpau_0252 PE=4 SV=1 [Tsukamurella paurometabola]|uniref:Uncharacterized protein n=2 Tax=Tsukamurella paurometabola TaxID=2061 RepID=D5UQR9_TSUPD|nr:hypothetical protein Tpau_0252 [Tsukamurella paurometabola DSM 20162]SUP42142.1 Uncharacterised protein [Tsukamurella paurometabola]
MSTTTSRLTARQRARARVEASRADQVAREQRQIAAVATYFDEEDKLARLIERGEIKHRTAQRDALAVLVDTDGMSAAAIAKLIGVKAAEVRAVLDYTPNTEHEGTGGSVTESEQGDGPDADGAADSGTGVQGLEQ